MQLRCDLKYMVYNRPKNENVEMIYNDLSYFGISNNYFKNICTNCLILFLGQIGRAAS